MVAQLHFFYEASMAPLQNEQSISAIVHQIFSAYQTECGTLNVVFLDSETHTKMNSDYLGHDYPTDILTFPSEDESGPAGEVYINEEVAEQNAHEYANSLAEELARLIFHGALHLSGLNDSTKAEKEIMRSEEDKYLSQL